MGKYRRYGVRTAKREANDIIAHVTETTKKLLEAGKYRELARFLLAWENELSTAETVARILRFMGELNYDVYKIYTNGIVEALEKAWKLIEEKGENVKGKVIATYIAYGGRKLCRS